MISIKLKNVSSEILKLRQAVRKEAESKLEAVCKEAVRDLKANTPVDTGLARDSWSLRKTLDPFAPFQISNSAPYIDILNAGHSKQAPSYFVEATMLKYGNAAGAIVQYTK